MTQGTTAVKYRDPPVLTQRAVLPTVKTDGHVSSDVGRVCPNRPPPCRVKAHTKSRSSHLNPL